MNGLCRDIPDYGLTQCGVVKLQFNDYMTYADVSLDPEIDDSVNTTPMTKSTSVPSKTDISTEPVQTLPITYIDPQQKDPVDPFNVHHRQRRRAFNRNARLTRIIGGADTTENRWPWQVSITKNSEKIPDPMTRVGNKGCDFFLNRSAGQKRIFY